MGVGRRRQRVPEYRAGFARRAYKEPVLESAGDGGLLRSGDPVCSGELHLRSPRPAGRLSQKYFLRYLRFGTHGLCGRHLRGEDEEGFGGVYAEGWGAIVVGGHRSLRVAEKGAANLSKKHLSCLSWPWERNSRDEPES